MTLNIPNSIFDIYYEACDYMLTSNFFSRDCKVVYPPIKTECGNCIVSMIGDTQTNTYRHGGPAPFSFDTCPLCGGNGLTETESTETLRLRIFFDKKDWKKITSNIDVPDATAMIIGNISDLKKVRKASEIVLITGTGNPEFRFALTGEPFPHGFGKNRYFIAFLKRS